MRDIRFRGKRITGEWVYGSLVKGDENYSDTYYILTHGINGIKYEVHPETIGQFTEQRDKYNNDIYDGAIVKCKGDVFSESIIMQVVYAHPNYPGTIMLTSEYNHCPLSEVIDDIAVLGNVHDNPELLKEAKQP